MIVKNLKYLVVENSEYVCKGIIDRMVNYTEWSGLGYTKGVLDSTEIIANEKPQLIFLDWDLAGGSAYEILQFIQNTANYDPYIIFNTGFQKDYPDIPQEIINNYRVDKYLVKPIWENLRLNLPAYLDEARCKANQGADQKCSIWIESVEGKMLINLKDLIIICQNPVNSRLRKLYFKNRANVINVKLSWKECESLLQSQQINYFILKQRAHIIIKEYVLKYTTDFVWMEGFPYKLNIVKENYKLLKEWLCN